MSPNKVFTELADGLASRRQILKGGLAAAATSFFTCFQSEARSNTVVGRMMCNFDAVPAGDQDAVIAPSGYSVQVLAPWGEAIVPSAPTRMGSASASEQAGRIGMHHDGLHYFPILSSSEDGLLVINHEYIEPRFLHESYSGRLFGRHDVLIEKGVRNSEHVKKELCAHGISIIRISRDADGNWTVRDDPRNRRITGLTHIEISGPVRGVDQVRTKYSPSGTGVQGTLNNCAGSATPWNTYLAAEENWADYFCLRRSHKPSASQARYGIRTGRSIYAWELAEGRDELFLRFDITPSAFEATQDYRNEANCFGWMVEVDPFNPGANPIKRTALGRFAHEGVVFAPVREGRPVVCYSGDDAKFEYIYKFVSQASYESESASGDLLDQGTLYAARFEDDGTGEWLPLVYGLGPLTEANGFTSQADVLVNARIAADYLGATKMDRPEWGAIDPTSGEVYFALSNNNARATTNRSAANPRSKNIFGHIIRWSENDGDHAAERFSWSVFLLAGPAEDSRDANGSSLSSGAQFACPDGLSFDKKGRLWIQTDVSDHELNRGKMASFGNNQMLVADPLTGHVKRFLVGPVGQEITGFTCTPDQRTIFVNIQHPGATTSAWGFAAGRYASNWPDGPGAVPRSATIAISRVDGGFIGE